MECRPRLVATRYSQPPTLESGSASGRRWYSLYMASNVRSSASAGSPTIRVSRRQMGAQYCSKASSNDCRLGLAASSAVGFLWELFIRGRLLSLRTTRMRPFHPLHHTNPCEAPDETARG